MDGGMTKKEAALELFRNGATLFQVMEQLDLSKARAYEFQKVVRDEARRRDAERLSLEVWKLLCDGLTPSEIDAELQLPEGNAHDVIVHEWRLDQRRQPSMVTIGGGYRV